MSNKFRYSTIQCLLMEERLLKQCSDLFSTHYGVYSGKDNHKCGQRIRLGIGYYRRLREHKDMYVSLCFKEDELIGQAFYLKKTLPSGDQCSWVTQLVVNSTYRNNGIAKKLLHSAWGFSNYIAWGLATANALTLKTLRSVTFREIEPASIIDNIGIIEAMCDDIDFVREKKWKLSQNVSQIFTNFYPLQEVKDQKVTDCYVKCLGKLKDGYEWLAFTFREQDSILWEEYHEDILSFSAQQLEEAYGRMDMDNQPWTRYTSHEIDYILTSVCTTTDCSILDLGCGTGRHTIELAKRGYFVTAVESSPELIHKATDKALRSLSQKQIDNITFVNVDARKAQLIHGKYDVVICLYDVIGSYRTPEDNEAIIKTIYRKLKKGGKAVISVMNMDLTIDIARNVSSVRKTPKDLLPLPSSNIMQSSGNVFDPDYFLLDKEDNLVYRKEQFEKDGLLSSEYVIADYRYTKHEICEACERNGLRVLDARYVALGHWHEKREHNDRSAKEILLVLQKQ